MMAAPFRLTFALAVMLVAMAACTYGGSSPKQTPEPQVSTLQLPGGGTTILPRERVVALYGAAGVPGLGVLGQGTPELAAARLLKRSQTYARFGRPVLPAFELIATIVQQEPGLSGTYSVHAKDADVARYLAAARRIHALLILDIQPGYRSFADDVRHYDKYLAEPDVGLALDSEWSMNRPEVPGSTIGHTTAAAVNEVSAYLAGIVATHHLPQKLLVIHEFTAAMVLQPEAIVARPGLGIVFHIDGFGSRALKRVPYRALHRRAPFFNGLKLFLTQDIDMFSPADVMHFNPPPDLITYE